LAGRKEEYEDMKNWKTTVNGILAAFLATIGPASAGLAAYDLLIQQVPGHSHADFRVAIAGIVLTGLGSIARAWIGLLQSDALPPTQAVTQDQLKAVGITVSPAPKG
jgi:hypothetical protein